MQKTEKDRKRPNLTEFDSKKYRTLQNATKRDRTLQNASRKNTKSVKKRQKASNLFLEKFGRKKKRIDKSKRKE